MGRVGKFGGTGRPPGGAVFFLGGGRLIENKKERHSSRAVDTGEGRKVWVSGKEVSGGAVFFCWEEDGWAGHKKRKLLGPGSRWWEG